MFCSKCGKTIRPEDEQCPHCMAQIGESKFDGVPYTSVQKKIAPGGSYTVSSGLGYTRTTYTGMDKASIEQGDADARTTYRPVYEGSSAPEEVREELRNINNGETQSGGSSEKPSEEVSQITAEVLGDDFKMEEIDMSQFKSRPIEAVEQAGISPDVSEYIQRLDSDNGKRSRGRREGGYDGYEPRPEFHEFDEGEDVEHYDNASEDGYPPQSFGLNQIIKIAGALVVVAALFVGGMLIYRHFSNSGDRSPIAGVSYELYQSGIELITQRSSEEYVTSLLSSYQQNGIATVTSQLLSDSQSYEALMPQEPLENDAAFISALEAIQSNIGNAITMDALALTAGTSETYDSQASWQIINNSVTLLKQATTIDELNAIINGEVISLQTATPVPTPTPPNYNTLSKGSKGDEVAKLQELLTSMGYYEGTVDGDYGTGTQTAVKKFQQAMGMDVTGIADAYTQELIFSESGSNNTQTTAPTSAPTLAPTSDLPVISPSDGVEQIPAA